MTNPDPPEVNSAPKTKTSPKKNPSISEQNAAIKIQSIFLMISPRKRFLEYIAAKGQYMAATLIQRHVRGFLCRKKLLPLITEIKAELGNLKTRSDLATSPFPSKTNAEMQPDYLGTDFDIILCPILTAYESSSTLYWPKILSKTVPRKSG